MRRLRNDLPYTFRPPQAREWVRPLGLMLNREIHLRKKYRIEKINDEGFNVVRELCEDGHSLMLAPNHSDHSDPHVMIELASRHALRPFFMGAREIFEVSTLAGWALQSMGVFSVDRDGPDLSAIKTSISLLERGTHPLVIFPEGEIYHHHRRLDPLNEGVASIILKGAARLSGNKKAFLVPVGLRFFHDSSVSLTFRDRLSRLEDRIGWTPKPAMPMDDRVLRLATGVLSLKETEFLGQAGSGDIQDRLPQLCENLLSNVESRYPRDAKATTPPERVRALRYRIRRRLLDLENPPTPDEREILLDDLDRVFTALQAHSYIGDYLFGDPTLDRQAEMVMKLEEDLLGFPTYPVARTARVTAGEPIAVSEMLASGKIPAKGGAIPLTDMLEQRLSGLLQ
ncbi:MAG: 1-acyl-sn-glycerol-3-phosphate acyltransferase [Gloeobacteraceae cyanobacterium ES-bin-144]|nr:1-acyl-sn-glycerol-3-phosphate acyltransferase [Verrucomicrobiales bacterium]